MFTMRIDEKNITDNCKLIFLYISMPINRKAVDMVMVSIIFMIAGKSLRVVAHIEKQTIQIVK